MSTGFDILITPAHATKRHPMSVLSRISEYVLQSTLVARRGWGLRVYRTQFPCEYWPDGNDPNLIINRRVDCTAKFEELQDILLAVEDEDIDVEVACVYERIEWDYASDTPHLGADLFTIKYSSPGFGLGDANRKFGPFRVHFPSGKQYRPDWFDKHEDQVADPKLVMKLSARHENVVAMKRFFKDLAAAIEPEHQLLVTEGDWVNPLDCHLIYHRDVSGFLHDLRKVLHLHNDGGGYFYEGRAGEFDPPFRSEDLRGLRYANRHRSREQAKELWDIVENSSMALGKVSLNSTLLEASDILSESSLLEEIEAEYVGRGVFAGSRKFVMGTLGPLYLGLLKTVVSKSKAKYY